MSLESEVATGNQAKEVLDSPVFREALTAIRGDIFERYENSTFREHDERTEMWRKLQALRAIEEQLRYYMTTGKLAEETLLDKITNKLKGA